MDKTKKKSVKRYVLWGVMALVVVGLAVMPLMARQQQTEDGPTASILSANATVGSIRSTVNGGGTLEAGDPENISIPGDVKITEFLVKNGDMVSEGEALAAVDKVSVMSAITGIEDSMSIVEKQMENYTDEKADTTVPAAAGGRVKLVYAEEGDRVEAVMLEHVALAVLSLDGKMSVTLTAGANLAVGDAVTVTLADGTEVRITSGYTNTTMNKKEIRSVKLLENGLPEDHYNRTNGFSDEKLLLGKFEGKKTGKCRMYVWLDQENVIEIKATDYTVFINSKDEDEMNAWYQALK